MMAPVKRLISSGLVVVALVGITQVFPAGAGVRRPAVALASESPVAVAGAGFRRGERVRVRATVDGRTTARVAVAGRTGRFVVRFAAVDATCKPVTVAAVGALGSRAALRRFEIPPPCGIVIQG
jgi:hypothetical protein